MVEIVSQLQMPGSEAVTAGFIAASGLLLVFFLVLYRREQNLESCRVKVNLEGKSPKWIEKKSNELLRVEAYRLAGDFQAHLKRWEDAAQAYLKGGNYIKAAESFIAAGKKEEAAKAYLESRNFERAAALFLETRDYLRAARACEEAGAKMRAAAIYMKGGEHERAGDIFLQEGLYRQAAEAYAEAERWSKAADALWRCFGQERIRLPEDMSSSDSMPLKILARQSGELFKRSGRLEEAVEAFEAGGWFTDKAETLSEAGRHREAAQAFLEAGDKQRAAKSFEQAGETTKAAALNAEFCLDKGMDREAVTYLFDARQYEKAAEILERHGEYEFAAEAYEKAAMHQKAAELYRGLEQYEPAARCMEEDGRFKEAADLYARAGNMGAQAEALEKAGEYVSAGANYFERGLYDRAIAALQKVEPEAEDYAAASLLLGQIFREKGMLEMAYECFKRSIRDREMSRSNLENYYHLAVCAERMGSQDEAASIYERILVLDYHFRDVADKLNAVRKSRTVMDTAPEAAQATTPGTPAPGREEQEVTVSARAGSPIQPVSVGRDERYTLLEELGRGGMGIVYKARDNILERIVAYKVLPADLKEHPQALKNFFREAKSAAKLNHPNIVTVYDAGEESGTYYIAMEYVEGETIKDILNRQGRLPVKAVLMIAGQICKALEYAHARKIVHRDVKSSNVMWTPEKQVKLMDFGLAKVIEEVKGYQTVASGTPYYMSPEQTLGRDIDHRTDLYSLGITMFEMATGKLPFTLGDAAYHHVHTPPPDPRSIYPDLPRELSDIILRLMEKKPDNRFQEAKELFAALREVL